MWLSSNFKSKFWSLLQEFYFKKKAVNTELQVKLFKAADLLHTYIQKLYKVQYIGISFPIGYM